MQKSKCHIVATIPQGKRSVYAAPLPVATPQAVRERNVYAYRRTYTVVLIVQRFDLLVAQQALMSYDSLKIYNFVRALIFVKFLALRITLACDFTHVPREPKDFLSYQACTGNKYNQTTKYYYIINVCSCFKENQLF